MHRAIIDIQARVRKDSFWPLLLHMSQAMNNAPMLIARFTMIPV